jgi:hypothetical protein
VGIGRVPRIALIEQRRGLLFEHIGNSAQHVKKLVECFCVAQHAQALEREDMLL